ncbi:AAA family ATPase [Cyanobacterium sp. DS4]|uniref:AAA family ATPase n=1 Tax=Cyanobacterium sp. DS4 TaxID=2878255 RepID=UPI002E801EDB|nr:AAA family ATPase [Cyanobacterium sp. Dongsha4]WVL00818.1 AAA family ATPase [Cyanobacterium sp. Dongsha4]
MKKSPQFISQSLPAVTGVLVAGIINVTGGNALQTFMGLTTATMGGYASTALVNSRRSIAIQEIETLEAEKNRLQKALKINGELDYLQQQQELLITKISNLEEEKQDLERRIIAIKQENFNLEELEIRIEKNKALKTEINELTAELNTIKEQIKERENQKDNLSVVSSQFLQKQAKLNDLMKTIDKLKKSKENLEITKINYEGLKEKYTILENEKNDILENIEILNNTKTVIQDKINQQEKYKVRLNNVQEEFEHKNYQLEELNNQIENLKRKREELETFNINYNALKEEYSILENKQNQILDDINNLNHQKEIIQDNINENEKYEIKLNNIKEEFEQKQNELANLNDKLENLNQQIGELEIFRSSYDALKNEYETLENQQETLALEIPRLQSERDRILQEIQTIETKAQQVDLLRRELDELDAKFRIKRDSLSALKRKIQSLDTEKQLLENEIHLREVEIKRKEAITRELQEEIKRLKEDLEEIKNSVDYAFQALKIPVEVKAKQMRYFANESDFLTEFKVYLKAKGLTFSDRVINAFHTSLKVQDISALVILAGISGTGKSELPQAYCEFIGAPLVMLPVQPRWDSPQDLQGFFNYIEKKYKPTELMRYLYQHKRQNDLKNRMVLVLLDEMNLARVEYYFSDFLSKLESRRNKDTFLEIEAGSLKLPTEEKWVKIPEQFLFVGTMNEDETTQSLSDKVLDRANVLTFGKPPELKLRGVKQKVEIPEEYLSWETFNSWCQQPQDGSSVLDSVKDYVNRVNHIMEALGRPFAHRVYQAIAKYVVNYPNALQDDNIRKSAITPWRCAIADQFGQKLLPKLRGLMVEDSNVKPQLDELKRIIDELGDESLKQAFEVARNGQYGQFQWKGMVYQETIND